ncbi:hypothetical protein ACFT30_18275 [Microbacterium ureisolvens]|uniref:hypothetical protein n=1 Tax=Microbacterium ureisolvens TaxID=2781186 RepID=UPI0036435CC2
MSGGDGRPGGSNGHPPTVIYAWSLPKTDTSPNDFQDGPAYAQLLAADCDGAARRLDASNFTNDPAFGVFRMKTPRYVVLLSAGIAMCRAAFDEARKNYSYAMDKWGTQGLDHPSHPAADNGGGDPVTPPWRRGYREPECDLYRALTYSLTGAPADSLQCPGGLRPVHHYVKYTTETVLEVTPGVFETHVIDVTVWDNPLTFNVDESHTPPEQWNKKPGIEGTSPEVGADNTGNPDDEFDVPAEQPASAGDPAEADSSEALDLAEPPVASETGQVEPAPAGSVADVPATVEPAPTEVVAETPAPSAPALGGQPEAEPATHPEGTASVPAPESLPAAPSEAATSLDVEVAEG